MSNELETYESNTLVFMVKIWVEERADGKTKAKWRGYITHIPSGARQYVEDLNEIIQFILPYLEQMGVRPGFSWQTVDWMRRLVFRSLTKNTKKQDKP